MRRIGLAAVIALVFLSAFVPSTARAAGVWDPNDPIRRFDMRWVGLYAEGEADLRVTVRYYERVRLKWFDPFRYGHFTSMQIPVTSDPGVRPALWVIFGKKKGGRIAAQLCEGGSGCFRAPVSRPDPYTIRTRLTFYFSFEGFAFRGRSSRGWDGEVLDRTRWARVT